MTLLMLREMVASALGDRLAIGTRTEGTTDQQRRDRTGVGTNRRPAVLADVVAATA